MSDTIEDLKAEVERLQNERRAEDRLWKVGVTEKLDKIGTAIHGDEDTPGIRLEVDRLKTSYSNMKWAMRSFAGAAIAAFVAWVFPTAGK